MNLKNLLDKKYEEFNRLEFIENDPISIPHQYSRKQDIEIMGFWTAMLSWGQRVTIINKCNELGELMDHQPYEFVLNLKEKDFEKFKDFKHRTFNFIDTQHFLKFFNWFYNKNDSLEDAFVPAENDEFPIENSLNRFHDLFFSLKDSPYRTKKHVSCPKKNSTCKRLNMFLRWMVRKDSIGVDFGIWDKIKPSQLLCPLDVHVERVARNYNLIERKQRDWQTVIELSQNLSKLDPSDPVKYDFALFGMGLQEKYQTNEQ